MAWPQTIKLPSFEGVAPGQTATLNIPVGWTYHDFLLTYSGAALSELNEIRLLVNGKVIRRYKGGSARLDTLNQYDGLQAAGGVIRMSMDRVGLITRKGREHTALGTGMKSGEKVDGKSIGLQPETVTIEVDIDGAATAPALSAKARRSGRSPVGEIIQLAEYTYNAPASGDYEIADIPRPPGQTINRLFLFSSDINSLKVERDGYKLFERDTTENDQLQTDGVRVPQAGVFAVDPTELGYGGDPIVIDPREVNDFRMIADMAGSGPVPVAVEYMGPLSV